MSVKSIVRDIKASLEKLGALLDSTDLKDSKKADIVIERAQLQKLLLEHEKDEREEADAAKIAEMTTLTEQQASRIAELESENRNLRLQPREVRTVLDPEHESVRQRNAVLTEVVEFAASSLPETERPSAVVRAIKTLNPEAARQFCDAIGVNYREYMQMMRWSDIDLQSTIHRAQIEGPAVLCACALLKDRGVKTTKQDDWL